EDQTTISRGYSGKTMRVIKNDYTAYWEEHLEELQKFPNQALRSINDGNFHLGGNESTEGVNPENECYPAGQGTGAIHELIPAGELVLKIVDEAEKVIAASKDLIS
ncbi:2-nitropropane dioxygenase NPD, partial [mine drainage metagenome]